MSCDDAIDGWDVLHRMRLLQAHLERLQREDLREVEATGAARGLRIATPGDLTHFDPSDLFTSRGFVFVPGVGRLDVSVEVRRAREALAETERLWKVVTS